MRENRMVTPEVVGTDAPDQALRPVALDDFVGQKKVQENLAVFIEAARRRADAMDHVLLYGPPGLGKTTLSRIVARELGVGFRATSGPVIAKAGDLAAILTRLQPRDVLFIDEIHRLNPAVEEILYPAMEDFQLDLVIGEGPAARSVRIDLPPFTLVGATTRSVSSRPLFASVSAYPCAWFFIHRRNFGALSFAGRGFWASISRTMALSRSPGDPAERRGSRDASCVGFGISRSSMARVRSARDLPTPR